MNNKFRLWIQQTMLWKEVFAFKKLCSVLVVVLLLSTCLGSALASETNDTTIKKTQKLIEESADNVTRGSCYICQNGLTGYMCLDEYVHAYTVTHTPWFGSPCTVRVYQSRSVLICASCHGINEVNGYHDCWEFHNSCSYGNYHFCPIS